MNTAVNKFLLSNLLDLNTGAIVTPGPAKVNLAFTALSKLDSFAEPVPHAEVAGNSWKQMFT